jgi:hypothetical protein
MITGGGGQTIVMANPYAATGGQTYILDQSGTWQKVANPGRNHTVPWVLGPDQVQYTYCTDPAHCIPAYEVDGLPGVDGDGGVCNIVAPC